MCGICGILNKDNKNSNLLAKSVISMNANMSTRGPDYSNVFKDRPSA